MEQYSFKKKVEGITYQTPVSIASFAPEIRYTYACKWRVPRNLSSHRSLKRMMFNEKTDYCSYHDNDCNNCMLRFRECDGCSRAMSVKSRDRLCVLCNLIRNDSPFSRSNNKLTFSGFDVTPDGPQLYRTNLMSHRIDLIRDFLVTYMPPVRLHIHLNTTFPQVIIGVWPSFHIERDYKHLFDAWIERIVIPSTETENPLAGKNFA